MDEELNSAMLKARVGFLRHPNAIFMSTVCFMLKLIYRPDIRTAATNGTDLLISPEFFMKCTPGARITILAHETMHVVLQHCMDMKKYACKDTANRAMDYVVNQFLHEAKFEVPFCGWLQDDKYRGMTTKQVYDLLIQNPPPPIPSGGSGGSGNPGDPGCPLDDHLPPGGTNEQGEPLEELEVGRRILDILNTAQVAANSGGQAGSVPGEVQVFLDKLRKPKLPLAQKLRRFFTKLAKNDYSWRRPNRRFMPIIMPSLAGIQLSEIAFAYDMSGSVSDQDTTRYQSELVGVLKFLKPDSLRLVQFDTAIISDNLITSLKVLANIKLCGRGGTDINPLMEWAKKHKPTALVVFTDGEFAHASLNPGIPVLWVIHGRRKERFRCSFGEIIRFDV